MAAFEQKEKIQDSQLKGKIVENNALKSKLESIQNELNTTRLLSAAKQNKTQQVWYYFFVPSLFVINRFYFVN